MVIIKKTVLVILTLFAFIVAKSQTIKEKKDLNLGFEKTQNGLPAGWESVEMEPNGIFTLDSIIKKNGKYSISIETKTGNPNFKRWSYRLPNIYDGKKIKLSGFVKSENITEGEGAFFIRTDPNISFNSTVYDHKIKGTTDWTKYEIEIDLKPKKTDQIVIGGYFTGKGKIWFDDFEIFIDGKDLNQVPIYQKPIYAADLDNEFDSGSKINISKLNNTQIQNIKILGLVWGFLKYHHPAVASGKYNWDYELFRILPKIIAVPNRIKRDETFVEWIRKLGEVQGSSLKVQPDFKTIKLRPDLSWINNSKFSEPLHHLLIRASLKPSNI